MKEPNAWITRYVTWITRHPILVIGAVLVVTIALATQFRHLELVLDPDKSLPSRHPLVILGDKITSMFGGKYSVVASIEVKEGDIYNARTLEKVIRITDKFSEIPGVATGGIISLSASNVKDIVGSSEGMKISRIMPEVPRTDEDMAELKRKIDRNDTMRNLLVSADGKLTSIIVDFSDVGKAGGFMRLYETLEKITGPENDATTTVHLAGIPVSVYWMGVYSMRMKYVFPLALLVIGLLLYLAFRTLQGLIIPLLTAILSVLWSVGLLGLFRTNLDTYNLMTPILVLAIGAGHSVQILKRYYEEYNRVKDNRQAVIESTSRIGVAMLTAGFVAASGFASLVTFQTPSIRNFGLLTAFGIVAALIIEMTFIPALRSLLRPPNEKHALREARRSVFDPILERFSSWLANGKGWIILVVTAVIVVVAVFGIMRLKTDNSLSASFSKDSSVIKDLSVINSKTAGANVMQVFIEGKAEDALKDPQALRDMEELENYISGLPRVGKVVSLVDFIKKMNKAMHGDDPQYNAIPESKDLVAQYLLLYSMSGDPGDFDRIVDFGYQHALMTIYMKDDAYAKVKGVKTSIDEFVRTRLAGSSLHYEVGGGISIVMALSDVIIHGKIYNILQICGIIFLIGSLMFLSFTGGGLILLPLVVAILVNLGVMGLGGIWLSIPTAAISAMSLGIGADYAIYFLFRFREEIGKGLSWQEALRNTQMHSGKAILFVASSITLGYICLITTGFLIHIYLGILVPLTMIVSSLGALTLMPAALIMLKPKFVYRFTTNSDGRAWK